MATKGSNIRVSLYTGDLIRKLSKERGVTQGELVKLALEVSMNHQFSMENISNEINNHTSKSTDRVIAILKTQDKNLEQLQKNLVNEFNIKQGSSVGKLKLFIGLLNKNIEKFMLEQLKIKEENRSKSVTDFKKFVELVYHRTIVLAKKNNVQ